MKYIAHVYDGQIYVIEAPTMIGVVVGAGSQVFTTMADVQAAWPAVPFADSIPKAQLRFAPLPAGMVTPR